jgi:hypothetical protein
MHFQMNGEKPNENLSLLKVELEDAKKIEDIWKQHLSEKKARCEDLEEEIVKTRKEMEKFKALYHQNLPSIKASEELTFILNQQRNPKLKVGLGYDVGMFYRQHMLVIDGKYNNNDGLSTGRMCQVGTISILGRRSRESSISSSSDSAEDC